MLIKIYEIRLNLFHSPIQPLNNPKFAQKNPLQNPFKHPQSQNQRL
jgi:hypothetical protein